MTPLAARLARQIAATGPVPLSDFMAMALMDPDHGYYATRPPFGTKGDFITAPEISQMFGELVGLCLAQTWLDQGAPQGAVLAELGPGRGTLMADVLRATAGVPGFHAAVTVHLVEGSARLRAEQAQRVPGAVWHDDVADLPEAPLFLIANEFLDALPVRQFRRTGTGWREKVVGLGPDKNLIFGWTAPAPLAALTHRLTDTAQGDLVEICPVLPAVVGEVGQRIETHGGGALFIDYGHWRSLGDTLQAIKAHQAVDPLSEPGLADLTTHVDFEAVARAAAPARPSALCPQGVFLDRLGIGARAQALAARLTGPALENHLAAYRRLTLPSEMGDLFKVMGVTPTRCPPPPGLEP